MCGGKVRPTTDAGGHAQGNNPHVHSHMRIRPVCFHLAILSSKPAVILRHILGRAEENCDVVGGFVHAAISVTILFRSSALPLCVD